MAVSVMSCHFSECASPHIFAALSVIRSVLKASIVIRFGLKCLNGFLLEVCDGRKSSLYFLSVVLVCLKSLNCMVRVEWIEVSFGSCHEFCFSYGFRPDTNARNDRRAVCLVRVRQGFQDVK